MAEKTKAVYMISVVAEMLDIHPQTLRMYEREGLVTPSRTEGGVRLYSEEDVERIRTVTTMTRELGVNLAGVEIILQMREKLEKMQAEMDEMASQMRRQFFEELARREELMKNPLVPAGRRGGIIKIKVTDK